ncbi:MAG: Nif3-like dinuclear metal center hexameric protein [Planctomycetes bacterium]|nr:Nif3-like dinuclear metal center hexameric protein [Planctomycetota bacterium]
MPAPSLAEVLDILHEIAPLELAAEWDNVGLLLQPRERPGRVRRVLLTIDLGAAVVAEARRARADLVVSYHPPIFQPLRRLGMDDGRQRPLLQAAAAGIAVYSPHTALDAAPSGLADWLLEGALGGEAPRELHACGEGEFGRLARLARPLSLPTLLRRLKRHLGVRQLQLAQPARPLLRVRSLAVAAGAGGSVLRGAAADVLVTGEMSHHDTLAATAAGRAVVLAGHSHTERGFLPVLRQRLRAAFDGDLDVVLAAADQDPFVRV